VANLPEGFVVASFDADGRIVGGPVTGGLGRFGEKLELDVSVKPSMREAFQNPA